MGRNWKRVYIIVLSCYGIMASNIILAQPPNSGFSGNISIGGAWINTTNQLSTDKDNENIDDLDSEADSFDTIVPVPLINLSYAFKDKTQLYLGTPIGEGDPALKAGIIKPIEKLGEINIGIFWKPFGEVWEDPYLVDQDRDETSELRYGAQLEFNRILGSWIDFSYSYEMVDIQDDEIGNRIDALERDGAIHSVELDYSYRFNEDSFIRPGIGYTRGQIEGESNRYNGYSLNFSYSKMTQNYVLSAALSGFYHDYDRTHPLFNKSRTEKGFNVFGIYTWLAPFGFQRFFCNVGTGYTVSDSNIDFFDYRTVFVYSGIGYNF